jgi:DNA-binding GntR family transcriptional regulator
LTYLGNGTVIAAKTNQNPETKIGKADGAFKAITEQILARKIMPGQRLVERRLATEYGISKTPIREALLKLKEVGLATGDFHDGVYVAHFSGQDALEIFDLREFMEGLSARLAARKADEHDLNELEDILSKSLKAMTVDDSQLYSELDQQFHYKLIDIGENQRLAEIYSRLRLQAKVLMRSSMGLPGRGMEQSCEEHRSILDAIKTHDEEVSEHAARAHILNTRKAVEKWLKEGVFI